MARLDCTIEAGEPNTHTPLPTATLAPPPAPTNVMVVCDVLTQETIVTVSWDPSPGTYLGLDLATYRIMLQTTLGLDAIHPPLDGNDRLTTTSVTFALIGHDQFDLNGKVRVEYASMTRSVESMFSAAVMCVRAAPTPTITPITPITDTPLPSPSPTPIPTTPPPTRAQPGPLANIEFECLPNGVRYRWNLDDNPTMHGEHALTQFTLQLDLFDEVFGYYARATQQVDAQDENGDYADSYDYVFDVTLDPFNLMIGDQFRISYGVYLEYGTVRSEQATGLIGGVLCEVMPTPTPMPTPTTRRPTRRPRRPTRRPPCRPLRPLRSS